MKEQTGIDVPQPLSNDLYHYILKVDRSFRGVYGQKYTLFCIISSNVTLLATELLGQFQNFLNTPCNDYFMYINKSAFPPFFNEHYLFNYYSDAALFDLFV